MPEDYRRSHLASGKGRSYDETFSKNPYRSMTWGLEQQVLDRIVGDYFSGKEMQHLDFACGTGRILRFLAGRANRQVGVDVSASMLEVARQKNAKAEIIEADITRADLLGGQEFNLITAFRFFPNAEAQLREDALAALTKYLSKDGLLVFNNHKNTGSVKYRVDKWVRGGRRNGMSVSEVDELLGKFRIEPVDVYHLCIVPTVKGITLLPISLLRTVELALSRVRGVKELGENLIYVCRKMT